MAFKSAAVTTSLRLILDVGAHSIPTSSARARHGSGARRRVLCEALTSRHPPARLPHEMKTADANSGNTLTLMDQQYFEERKLLLEARQRGYQRAEQMPLTPRNLVDRGEPAWQPPRPLRPPPPQQPQSPPPKSDGGEGD